MDEFERRLTETLRARAEDAEPTPALWDEIRGRVGRRRWLTWMSAAAGVAAVVLLAAVVLPGVWEGLRGADQLDILDEPLDPPAPAEDGDMLDDEPAPEPTVEEPIVDAPYPDFPLLATDGSEIFVVPAHAAHDERERIALTSAPDGAEVRAVAVRPGSTADDLEAAVWVSDDGGHALHRLRRVAGDVSFEPFVAPYQGGDDAAPGSRPRPVWSPDGSYLAWVELPADETASGPRLRTIGWDDGPGTGDPATDDAAFTLDDLPLTPARAEVWFGSTGGQECPSEDTLTLRLTSEQLEAWNVRVQVQPDGALSLPPDAADLLLDDPYGTPVAYALNERVCDGMFAPYVLYAADADEQGDIELFVHDVTGHQGLPTPGEVRTMGPDAHTVPGGLPVWVTGLGDAVVVGTDSSAWVTARPVPDFDGDPVRIDGTVTHAEPIG
jgi:hypothetical protein